MNILLMYCWLGFEGEVCVEIVEYVVIFEIFGYVKSKLVSVYVEFVCQDVDGVECLMCCLCFVDLIFLCQWVCGFGFIELLESQCIEVLLVELVSYLVCGSFWLEVLDINVGKEVLIFCCKFEKLLCVVLVKVGWLQEDLVLLCLLLIFCFGWEVFVGFVELCNSVFWLMGILCLKFFCEVLSCLMLKLEEVWYQFILCSEWDKCLVLDMFVVDFGVVLGGWIW